MREVRRNAAQIETGPHRLATDTAMQLARRLPERLDALLEAESNRPFYHYQSLYHDPKGVYEGASIVPSPLAQGPTDPFIRAYFQIDPTGRVTLPTLPEGDLGAADRQRAVAERGIQKDLQLAAPASACVASLQQGQQQPRYEVMESDAYQQNAQAIQIYSDLKNGSNLVRRAMPPKDEKQKTVAIAIGGFQWCSLQTSNSQSLVALRDVTTPDGILVQGFVISNDGVAESLKNAALPARFLPNSSAGAYGVAARLE